METELSDGAAGEDLRLGAVLESAAPGVVVVLVQSPIGAAGSSIAEAAVQTGLTRFRRTAGREPARSRAGAISVELGIDPSTAASGGRPQAILLEEAQWADPTSLGLLRRLITHPDGLRLMVIAHRPPDELDRWWLESIASAARDHGVLIETTGAEDVLVSPIEALGEAGRELVTTASAAGEPITVAEAVHRPLPERGRSARCRRGCLFSRLASRVAERVHLLPLGGAAGTWGEQARSRVGAPRLRVGGRRR